MTKINTGQIFNCINEDDENESTYGETSVFSEIKKQKIRTIDIINNNIGRVTIVRQVMHSKNVLNNENNNEKIFYKKKTNISFYTTSLTPGVKIRNAVTGYKEPYIVGSKDEDLFFKVSLNTGELGQCPYSNHLFFESPEDYESLFYTKISDNIKNKWKTTYYSALDRSSNKNKEKRLEFIEIK